MESLIPCNSRDQINGTLSEVARILTNQSFATATGEHQGYEVEVRPSLVKRRTNTQNNCLHQYCTMLAGDLNAAGFERVISSAVLSEDLHVPWTMETVKAEIWIRTQAALTGKEKSRELDRKECSLVYETIARHMAQSFGITTQWPTWMNEGGKNAGSQGATL